MWRDSETEVDLLDFDYLIEAAKGIVLDNELTPSTIGIYGDWGSGKSSLMEMCMSELSKDPDILCLKFNGWLFEDYEDAKTALIGTILDKVSEKRKFTAKAKSISKKLYQNIDFFKLASKGVKYGLDLFITGGIGTIADITIETLKAKTKATLEGVKESDIKDSLKTAFSKEKIRTNLKSFQDNFASLLSETKVKRLVVFIDELDRCNQHTILETLEAVRLFLFSKGTSFIIGADERHVIYAVRTKYPEIKGNQLDIGKEYLEKMIQYPIRIPQLSPREVEFYIMCLFFQNRIKEQYKDVISFIKMKKQEDFLNFEITFEILSAEFPKIYKELKDVISLSKQISSVLAKGLNGNPRHCKRFLNSLSLRLRMADFKKMKLDEKILSKIMLLEYFKNEVYKKLGELQLSERGKPIEIDLIETNQWDKVKDLKLWQDDLWFQEWVKLEPKLGKSDLQPYYYFTRESLKNTYISINQSLSPDAQKILEGLSSGSDSSRQEALRKSQQINDFESSEILKSLIDGVENASKIELPQFKSFIEWGASKQELYIDAVSCLKRIPANKIKVAFIPRIKEFGEKIGKTNEIRELFNIWEKENPKLATAIQNE